MVVGRARVRAGWHGIARRRGLSGEVRAAQDTRVHLPTGDRVTFLFSDIEGSTRLAQRLDGDRWVAILREHDALVDAAVSGARGSVIKHEGDGTFAVFADPADALAAAAAISRAMTTLAIGDAEAVRVRIGLHTGIGRTTDDGRDYVGVDVHYAARIAAAANGGQIAVSEATRECIGSAIPDGLSLTSMGPRRLKDFEDPRPIHLLVIPGIADDGRPLRTIDAPTNLPTPPTNFVGRDDDLETLRDILGRTRLLTLTGPGGTGKTRLGLGLAASVADGFPGGTWFVDLAPVRDPELVAGSIAAALDIREEPGVPIARTLQDRLQPLTTLLVLDNLEQLLPRSAVGIAEILRAAPGLRLIVTSREVLRVAGEYEYQVPPLDASAGVQLFVDRARLVRPDAVATDADLAAVGAIVKRLEGLPLAIELAAARTRVFGPVAILERLESSLDLLAGGARDLPERQRTLRGAISWSHDLLSEDEQAIFRRLAVFVGGWDAEIAQTVVDPSDGLGLLVVDGLEALADKSMVRVSQTEHGEPRFDRHTLLREFALDRLDASGERPDCERRHALAFLDLAATAGPSLVGPEVDRWMDRLGHEQHNLRAALRWSIASGEPEVGLRILAAIWRYWQLSSQLAEGTAWATELLAQPSRDGDAIVRIDALSAAAGIAYWAHDFATARAIYEERLRLAEGSGDDQSVAEAHYEIGFMGMVDQDVEFLRHHETIALDLFERAGSTDGVLRARQALVMQHFLKGEYAEARALETLDLEEFRRRGARYRMSDSLALLAVASLFSGDTAAGRDYLIQSGRLTSGILTNDLAALTITSHLALRTGREEDGARLAGAAQQIALQTGVTNGVLQILHVPDPVDVARTQLGEPAERLIEEGRALALEDALALATTIASSEIAGAPA